MIELLSPAGSMEALRAAVQNGADAVYLGYGAFNARRNAKNFGTPEELREAVSYCHVRGVKVHLTLNILTSDREMAQVREVIRTAAEAGVDAFIVQDWGVCTLCRQMAPNIPVHGSTQMSVHSLEGVKKAAELGCSRVVLARELPGEEIARICRSSPVEIEVFGHGALCMCYSGQCYLSAVIGRRSGNRGQCAQPCRLPYGYGRFENNRYPLSLKDSCLLEYLRQLDAMGVASLKLEGRMKRPEYVAVVTRIYRKALDGGPVSRKDLAELEAIFSREGFTDGYFTGKKEQMFGVRQEGREDPELLAAARASYASGELSRVPVRFYALIQRGKPAMLAAEDRDGRICKAAGETPQEALHRSLSAQELEARLAKTGGTPYWMESCKSVIDPGLTLPAAAINALRRTVLAQLSAVRGRALAPRLAQWQEPEQKRGTAAAPGRTVWVYRAGQVTKKLLDIRPKVLYVPLRELTEHPELAARIPAETELCAALPRIIWDRERPEILSLLSRSRALGASTVLAGNVGHIALAQEVGMGVRGDFGLNLFNSRSMDWAREQGLVSGTASFEMTLGQLRDLSKLVDTEAIVYGRLPLMVMESCVIRNRSGVCACQNGVTKLVDRMGEEFPILKDGGSCRNVLLNGKKLYLLDKREAFEKLGLWALRLHFTTENPAEVDRILDEDSAGGAFSAGVCTRGLYLRGVE